MTRWDDDEQLLWELSDAVHGEVSERARAVAREAISWRTVDAELMRLTHDSSASSEPGPGDVHVRNMGTAPRTAGFDGADLSLEVELDGDTLMGQVVPGRECRVSIQSQDGRVVDVETDAAGVFAAPIPRAGLVRFIVTCQDTRQTTPWLGL